MLKGISIGNDSISVLLGGNIKQCRPNFSINMVTFQAYNKYDPLCVYKTLLRYMEMMEEFRLGENHKDEHLLISFVKPHRAVSKHTIAR